MKLIYRWHDMINMPKHDEDWYKQDLLDELDEYKEAKGFVEVWSELSDLTYTYTRAHWSGHKDIKFPLSKCLIFFGIIYMIPKYTLRWKFFRDLGHKFDKNLDISEVCNVSKPEKLKRVAIRYDLDPEQFLEYAKQLKKYRFFLP